MALFPPKLLLIVHNVVFSNIRDELLTEKPQPRKPVAATLIKWTISPSWVEFRFVTDNF